jgi:hypothetical protein
LPYRFSGSVSNVDKRQIDALLDCISRLVHRVGTKDQTICAAILNMPSGVNHSFSRFLPAPFVLERLDLSEIDRIQEASSRVQTAEPDLHAFIDESIVDNRRLPTHPANKSDGLHAHLNGIFRLLKSDGDCHVKKNMAANVTASRKRGTLGTGVDPGRHVSA